MFKESQGEFIVISPNPELRELLQIASIDTVIRVFCSVKDLLIAFPDVKVESE